MKAEDYTHRIGRTGRAGRDGLAVTFAEFRDRRKIFDIEAYSQQRFKAEILPGLEPQQRFPDSRPNSNFGGRNNRPEIAEHHSRDRKFGKDRFARTPGARSAGSEYVTERPRAVRAPGHFSAGPAVYGQTDNRSGAFAKASVDYERKGGFNDRFAGAGRSALPSRGAGTERRPSPARTSPGGPRFGEQPRNSRDLKKKMVRAA